ncbi:unnamed protein product [Brassica oleracea]
MGMYRLTAHKPYTYRVVHDQLMLLANTNTQLSDIMLSLRIERHVTPESFYIRKLDS